MGFYTGKKVLLTGGAGFIGTHLLERLIDLGADVTVVDDLSSGSLDQVLHVWASRDFQYCGPMDAEVIEAGRQRFLRYDLEDIGQARRAMRGQQIVIHEAAVFGGRGFVDTRPADCCHTLGINHNVFKAAREEDIERVHYASTACVYPDSLQNEYDSTYLLGEADAFRHGVASCDRAYGWAKFMGELELQAYRDQYGLKGSICRYVTAYGPRENDTHAIVALIKRAVERCDPYVVWGTGEQDRDFTFVDDIVEGTLLATERITDCSPINIGTGRRHKIKDVVKLILQLTGHEPEHLIFDPTKPVGVLSRALDNSRARESLGWAPRFSLEEGLKRTIAWYIAARPQAVETLV